MLSDWATFFLALLLVPVLLLEETSSDPGTVAFASTINAFIWFAFVLDYAIDLRRATDRGAYVRSHWFDLAIVVVSPPLFVPPEAQALRVLRILRIARAAALVGVIAERLDRPLARRDLLVVFGLLGVVILFGGVAITAAEPLSFRNVAQGYAWTVATLMTAGHADPQPVTAMGRAISSTVIVMGLGTFAAIAASLMSAKD